MDAQAPTVSIKPLLPGQWRWQVRFGGSLLGIRSRKTGVGLGRQDAVARARRFLSGKGYELHDDGVNLIITRRKT